MIMRKVDIQPYIVNCYVYVYVMFIMWCITHITSHCYDCTSECLGMMGQPNH